MHQRASSRFETGAQTHPGNVREQNEDAHMARPDAGVWAVADGMGGHDAGQLASSIIVEALQSIEPAASAADLLASCEDRVISADSRLKRIAAERGLTIGATLAVLLAYGSDYACVWSGDSRIYLVRDGTIKQISRDHTEVQSLIEQGILTPEEGRNWPRRNVITRAIGVGAEPELEIEYGALADNDIFVLCSDGLTTHVADSEILDRVASSSPQEACDSLVDTALLRGGSDNVTVVVVRRRPGGTTILRPQASPSLMQE